MTAYISGLDGKGALVVGGGQGMGRATALLLAACGCDVAVVDLDGDRAKAVADEIAALGRKSVPLVYDVVGSSDHTDLVKSAANAIPNLQLMATIVGMAGWAPILQTTQATWQNDLQLNVGYFYSVSRAFTQHLVNEGWPGAIVGLSSVSGIQAAPQHAAYGAGKAAMISLAKTMASEWARHGVRVNTIAPGAISTPRRPSTPEKREAMKKGNVPAGRAGVPEEVANAVCFLLSDMASYITGQTLAVDGGWTTANIFVRVED